MDKMTELYVHVMAALSRRDDGQTLIEYALIAALIGVVLAASLTALATDISEIFSHIGSRLDAAY